MLISFARLRPCLGRMTGLLGLLGLLNPVAAPAQPHTTAPSPPDTAAVRIVRLPATQTLLLTKGWRYHPGDDPAWARPGFDDSAWDTLNPARPRQTLPPALSSGISWLRLRFRLGDSLRQESLLLTAGELGAAEFYLNGRLLMRHGQLSADPAQVRPRGRYPRPGIVPANGPAEQVLAVRLAPWQPALPNSFGQESLLAVNLYSPLAFWEVYDKEKNSGLILLVLLGFSGLLAVLHYAFYYYNPARSANRYFARFALVTALAAGGGYATWVLAFDTYTTWAVLNAVSSVLMVMILLWAVRALYELFDVRPGRVYAGLWLAYAGYVLVSFVGLYSPALVWSWLLMLVLLLAELLRLIIRARRQGRRGAGLILNGFAGAGVGVLLLVLTALVPGLLPRPLFTTVYALIFMLPALGISLYLAREFARDAQQLQIKLGEVETLSVQTLAQEQDKQALLAAQNETLETQVAQRTGELQRSLTDLQTTQTQLIQAEKMASLGELTAGIAHEIQNPLNFVNNFAEVSTELVAELKEAQTAGDAEEVAALADDLAQNLGKIHQHGQRAASIVRGMLEHSRQSSGERAPTDLNALCDEYLRLSYHGLRAKDKTFNAELKTDFAPDLPAVSAVGGDLGRVLLNLLTNAFYAVKQRQLLGQPGYAPAVGMSTRQANGQVEIRVTDNGTGMPAAVQAKIFQPFFTTKPTGEGTGLGLSLSYDIVTKGHGGTLAVESREGEGTTFIITLPG